MAAALRGVHNRRMDEYVAPVLRVADAAVAVRWYERLGFVQQWEHRFAPQMPRYVAIARGEVHLHLSEHVGDARPGALVYLYVRDVDAAAAACGVTEIDNMDRGRDFEVTDPDGNRLRVGTPKTAEIQG
jgi:catechol 2,3-dioxygenase-like lactoylglutathione lyase family enzyme